MAQDWEFKWKYENEFKKGFRHYLKPCLTDIHYNCLQLLDVLLMTSLIRIRNFASQSAGFRNDDSIPHIIPH